VSAYNHDGTAYVNSFNNPGVTADLPSNAIPDSALTQDLIAWYRFEDGDARDYTATVDATFADSTAYDGTVNGATYQSSGGVNDFENGADSGAFSFDGSGDYISIGDISDSVDFTVTLWANPNSPSQSSSPGEQQLVQMNDDGDTSKDRWMITTIDTNGDGDFGFAFFRDMVDVGGSTANTIITNEQYAGNTYHFVSVTYSSSDGMELYINNSLIGTESSHTDTVNSYRGPIEFGRSGDPTAFYNGNLDDVRFYNRKLTSSEISDIFNATKP